MSIKEIKEKAREEFKKQFNVHRTYNFFTGKIQTDIFLNPFTPKLFEDFLDSTIDSAISQAVKEREEEIIDIILKNSHEEYHGSNSFLQSNTDKIINLIKYKNEKAN